MTYDWWAGRVARMSCEQCIQILVESFEGKGSAVIYLHKWEYHIEMDIEGIL
jgi:hypothetical protein